MEKNNQIDEPAEVIESANKPTPGTYKNMTPSGERKPKVEFVVDKSVEVFFKKDYEEPVEFPSTQEKGTVYYLYNCIQNDEEKIFMTSAWSLLQGLKNIEPLAGKTVLITKDKKDGKQHYSVEEVTDEDDSIETVKPGADKSGDTPEVPTNE